LPSSHSGMHALVKYLSINTSNDLLKKKKEALILRRAVPTAIAWIRSHIGIHGNVQADLQAEFHSHLGVVALKPRTATQERIRARSRGQRAADRSHPGYGINTSVYILIGPYMITAINSFCVIVQ